MYLIDTNVISEARKGAEANAGVRAFWRDVSSQSLYVAVQTIGEIRCGLERVRARGDTNQAKHLEAWLEGLFAEHANRILPFDRECAEVWGGLMARSPHNPIDKQIAAIALLHDLSVVTRNVDDFADTGVKLENPFR